MLEYEVPVEGSSPINKTPDPRYISVNMMVCMEISTKDY